MKYFPNLAATHELNVIMRIPPMPAENHHYSHTLTGDEAVKWRITQLRTELAFACNAPVRDEANIKRLREAIKEEQKCLPRKQ